jgi:hypothetical protein
MKKILIMVLVVLIMTISSQQAVAVKPANPQCWGVVTSQMAIASQGMGDHASSFDSPRDGLGNVARSLGFPHISDLGSFLAGLDGLEETVCPSP